ncbi:CCA tRNA nucleotidyltransferase [Chondromyces crocatus]|uniref:Polynucleotide adenylyltransferase n=1 Tax=Chondromyces crocatus TaxID=52 RepID=A0A0K1EAZ6_CHOCO|nr:HD domain-containing protein [Chondromyces crocatus]AKT38040.1 polynucleotide adenylyltransferase [Chondromyces crocatus]
MSDIAHLIDLVPPDVLGICRRLREQGKRGWIVGGCVRDLLRGKPAKDWDVATDARPEETARYFRKVIPTGIQHGTVTVVIKGVHYEVTTLRGEGAYSDGRRPDTVEFVDDITADLARRDFTFNAIAIDPVDGHLIDPFGGRGDLEARTLRAVGKPDERFAEDGLRVLRGARFSATLECVIDPETERAMGTARSLDTFRRVSQERVREEWLKAMNAPRPSVAFEAMRRTGILAITSPELIESVGCAQNRYHAYDVWGHAMACLDACRAEPILRMAALLHDVGKPRTRAFSDKTQDYTFYDHERVGAEMVEPFLTRLRFSNEQRARIVALVRHHLICYSDDWSDAAVRRWLRRVTPGLAPELYEIGTADALGKGLDATESLASIERLRARAEAVMKAGAAMSTRDLALNGGALMKALGIKPGPIVGQLLDHLVEVVTDDPEANTPDRLLDAARQRLAEPAAS